MASPDRIQKVVREAIEDTELPRTLLARDGQVSRASVEAWVSGIRNPSPESIEQLANGLMARAAKLQQIAVRLMALREQLRAGD